MSFTPSDLAELRALLGDDGLLASDAALFTYEADALTIERFRPDLVVLPRSTDEVSAVVRWARQHHHVGDVLLHHQRVGFVGEARGSAIEHAVRAEQGAQLFEVRRSHCCARLSPPAPGRAPAVDERPLAASAA